ncbi:FMN-binding protein [Limnohabitans sp.]|uniref:FMN-binding protein n=1 Tax=Limnohabitans sp. TaxID=1907725 RepID=UPI0038BCD47B
MRHPHLSRRQMLQHAAGASLGGWGLCGTAAFAAEFMRLDQARQSVLPQAQAFSPLGLGLNEATLSAVAQASQTRIPRGFNPQCWQATASDRVCGWAMADRVIGKYDIIDYVVGFTLAGAVSGLEVTAYRESHGAEIRNAAWRHQFTGRKGPGQLRFGDDIRNISGATLSCQHVTEGVQRLSALLLTLPNLKLEA